MKKIVKTKKVTEYSVRLTSKQASFLVGLLNHVHVDDLIRADFSEVYDALTEEVEEGQKDWTVSAETSPWSDHSVIRVRPKG